jgi:hypothetical protein
VSKPRNPQIGTCPCPVRDCDKVAKLFRFKEASAATPGRRFAGRLYGDCEDHGRFGGDGRTGINEYFLNKGKIWPAGQKPAEAAAEGSPVNVQKSPVAAPKPAPVTAAVNVQPLTPARESQTAATRPHLWDL